MVDPIAETRSGESGESTFPGQVSEGTYSELEILTATVKAAKISRAETVKALQKESDDLHNKVDVAHNALRTISAQVGEAYGSIERIDQLIRDLVNSDRGRTK